jgi:hypothetical protein
MSKPVTFITREAARVIFGDPSDSTFYEGIAAGRFPRPVKIGPQAVRWIQEECHTAQAALIAARDKKPGRR